MWNDIGTCPEDEYVLFKFTASESGMRYPVIFIGEAITFKGKKAYLWRGDYSEVISNATDFDPIPTHWMTL